MIFFSISVQCLNIIWLRKFQIFLPCSLKIILVSLFYFMDLFAINTAGDLSFPRGGFHKPSPPHPFMSAGTTAHV